MNRAEFIFTLIDVIGKPIQNTLHFEGLTKVSDVSYNDSYDRTKCDIYFREADKDKRKPVLIYFPGGGFCRGDKECRTSIAEFFANEGFCVFNTNYRLAPDYHFPDPLFDLVNILNFVAAQEKAYNLDLSKIVVSGDSSGGYMAAFCVAITTSPSLCERLNIPECNAKPSGLIGLCGVYDVVKMIRIREPLGIAWVTGNMYLGKKFKRNFKDLKDYPYLDCVSPIDFVNKDWCPSLIVYSKKDLFCHHQGERMLHKLAKNGIPITEYHSTRLIDNHCFHQSFWTKASRRALEEVKRFLSQYKAEE